MLTYKSYYNKARLIYVNRLTNKNSHVTTRLGTDHHQLIMPPISKDCSDTFLERSFIYAAPCEWNKLSEHIRTDNFDSFMWYTSLTKLNMCISDILVWMIKNKLKINDSKTDFIIFRSPSVK